MNTLQKLLNHFPDPLTDTWNPFPYRWKWDLVSKNPNITWEYIQENPNFPWDWDAISYNPNITPEHVKNNPDKSWSIWGLCNNKNFSLKFITTHFNIEWDNTSYVYNYSNPRYFCQLYDLQHREQYREHLSMSSFAIKNYISSRYKDSDDQFIYKHNPNVYPPNLSSIKATSVNKDIECQYISCNPNLTIDIINKYPKCQWYWIDISSNLGITFNDIKNNPHYPWRWPAILQRIDVTWRDMQNHPNFESESESIYGNCGNSNITWFNMCERPDNYWNWLSVSSNANITPEIIKDNPDKPWEWHLFGISNNPNVTYDMIINNLDKKWDWACLGDNKFELNETLIYVKERNKNQKILISYLLLNIIHLPIELCYSITDYLYIEKIKRLF